MIARNKTRNELRNKKTKSNYFALFFKHPAANKHWQILISHLAEVIHIGSHLSSCLCFHAATLQSSSHLHSLILLWSVNLSMLGKMCMCMQHTECVHRLSQHKHARVLSNPFGVQETSVVTGAWSRWKVLFGAVVRCTVKERSQMVRCTFWLQVVIFTAARIHLLSGPCVCMCLHKPQALIVQHSATWMISLFIFLFRFTF